MNLTLKEGDTEVKSASIPISNARREKLHSFLVLSLIAVSGFPFFYSSQEYIFAGFLISTLYFFYFKKKLNANLAIIVTIFLIIETFQYVTHGGFNLRTFSGTYVRLFYAFFVVQLVGDNFYRHYVKLLYYVSCVSLIFYIGSFIPGSENLYRNFLGNLIQNPFQSAESFYSPSPNIIIYNFHPVLFSEARNSGPFWEPGAFAVFLSLALIFNLVLEEKRMSKRNIVFIISIITTLSTTGILVLFLYFFFVYFTKLQKNPVYIIIVLLLISLSSYLYTELPFLKDKIENNIQIADHNNTSRFGSALADYNSFKENPIIGYGRAGAKYGFAQTFTKENHRNNGIFSLLNTYGILITLIYFALIFLTFSRVKNVYHSNKFYPLLGFSVIVLLGFSQGLFLKPFFYSFLFLPFIHKSIFVLK